MSSPVDTTFVSGTTITSDWLNGVNDFTVISKGTTTERPSSPFIGLLYFDTTLDADGKPIWYTGTAWVDATGAVV